MELINTTKARCSAQKCVDEMMTFINQESLHQ